MLMIVGGVLDPNVDRLVEIARKTGTAFLDYRIPNGFSRPFTWNIKKDWPFPDNITGVFNRQDVFTPMKHPRPEEAAIRAAAWHAAIEGWLYLNPQIQRLNGRALIPNKLAMLSLAVQHGFAIPDSIISNERQILEPLLETNDISKPITGGDYCLPLNEWLAKFTGPDNEDNILLPAIVQNRLVSPEIRIFIVGDTAFAFEVRSPSLDYRVHQDAELIPIAAPIEETTKLKQLMQALSMNYGAADFKTDALTGKLNFMELNSMPMFAAFDQTVNGELARAIIHTLIT